MTQFFGAFRHAAFQVVVGYPQRAVALLNLREHLVEAINEMAQDPATTTATLAIVAFPTVSAQTARLDARRYYAIAFDQTGDALANIDNRADSFMAENSAGLHGRHVALKNVEIGSADRSLEDANQDVINSDFRDGDFFQIQSRFGMAFHECLHGFAHGARIDERMGKFEYRNEK